MLDNDLIKDYERILFKELLSKKNEIAVIDGEYYKKVKERWDMTAKPLDSLGVFEDITAKIGSILKTSKINLEKKAVIVMCADNGVVEEGISQSGSEVTLAVARAMGKNKSSVGKMAAVSKAKVIPVDIGINTDETIPGVLDKKVAKGTRNFAVEPAMTKEELYRAIQVGMDMVLYCKQNGYSIIGIGEMGIGNTTTSSAVAISVLSGRNKKEKEFDYYINELVGRGAGLSNEGLSRKKKIIKEAIIKYELYNADILTILQTVGGLDIAGLVGVIVGGACYGIPVVLDGVISAVAALAAVSLFPEIKQILIASHIGKEPAMKYIYDELELEPVIYGRLALGEGTGAVMMFTLLDNALSVYNEQTTFNDIKIEAYERLV